MYFIRGNIALREVFERLNHALDQRRKQSFGSINSNDQKQCSAQDYDCGDADAVQAHSDDAKHEAVQGAHNCSCTPQATIGEEAVSDETKKGEHCSSATFSANSSRSRATEAASDTNITSSREASTTMRKASNHNNNAERKTVDTRSELMSTFEFLKELFGIVRGQQLVLKDRFYALLLELGVLDAVLILLEEEDNGLRSLACDILSAVIIHNPSEVRNRILKNATQQDSSGPRRQVGNDDSKLERTTTGPMMTETQTRTASNDKRGKAGSAESASTIEAVSRRSDGDDARKRSELRDAGGKQGVSEEKTLQAACRNGLSAAEHGARSGGPDHDASGGQGQVLGSFLRKVCKTALDPIVWTGQWHEAKVEASVVENVGRQGMHATAAQAWSRAAGVDSVREHVHRDVRGAVTLRLVSSQRTPAECRPEQNPTEG
ncbi:hypothetical protein FGB62_318g02 [Gracilaria domingensis]|nr:hypothetical protein FGB62_318g02 [Gracilaria domingensis]